MSCRIDFMVVTFMVFSVAACKNGGSQQTALVFDDSKIITDILMLPEYESLAKDEAYKEYVTEYWDVNFSLFQKSPDYIEIMAEQAPKQTESKKKRNNAAQNNPASTASALLDFGKMLGHGVLAAPGALKGGLKLVLLEKKHDDLHKGFSEDKKIVANQFELQLKKILDYSGYLFQYEMNNDIPNYTVYKAIDPTLKLDTELMELINPMMEHADKFFLISMEVKTKVAINYLLTQNYVSNIDLVNLGITILNSSGKDEVNVDSNLLDDYYSSLNALVQSISTLENGNFSVPPKDWSKEKRSSLDLLVKNIRAKTELEVNSLNKLDALK